MNGYEKLVKEQLVAHGWRFLRSGKGSHEIWSDGQNKVAVNKTANPAIPPMAS